MIKGNASTSRNKPTLKELREAAGFSQEALARQLNVSSRSVQTWEKGGSIPGLEKAVSLARTLSVSLKAVAESVGIDTTGLLDDFSQLANSKDEGVTTSANMQKEKMGGT